MDTPKAARSDKLTLVKLASELYDLLDVVEFRGSEAHRSVVGRLLGGRFVRFLGSSTPRAFRFSVAVLVVGHAEVAVVAEEVVRVVAVDHALPHHHAVHPLVG